MERDSHARMTNEKAESSGSAQLLVIRAENRQSQDRAAAKSANHRGRSISYHSAQRVLRTMLLVTAAESAHIDQAEFDLILRGAIRPRTIVQIAIGIERPRNSPSAECCSYGSTIRRR